MNRFQKKCFIISIGLHLLLSAALVVVGTGFFSPHAKDSSPVDTFIAAATVDQAISGGGDNTAKQPPALAVTPPEPITVPKPVTPPPVAPPVVEPTVVAQKPAPVKEPPQEVKPPKNDAPAIEPISHKHKVVVDTTLITTSAADAKTKRDAQAKAAAAAAAAEKRRNAEAVSHALAGIRNGVAGSTEIKLTGPGGGGIPYGNFLSQVKKAYWDAWNVPDGVPDVTVKVTVTIARDGSVISARIIDASGNTPVDNSVQRALDRVKFAAPLPEGAKEDQRTVTINFNTEAKLEG